MFSMFEDVSWSFELCIEYVYMLCTICLPSCILHCLYPHGLYSLLKFVNKLTYLLTYLLTNLLDPIDKFKDE